MGKCVILRYVRNMRLRANEHKHTTNKLLLLLLLSLCTYRILNQIAQNIRYVVSRIEYTCEDKNSWSEEEEEEERKSSQLNTD